MSTYTIDLDGNAGLYQPHPPPTWDLLGTVSDGQGGTWALARNRTTGVFARLAAGTVRSLPQREIAQAVEYATGSDIHTV